MDKTHTNGNPEEFGLLTNLAALAAVFEGEGQYNSAKLLRAAADALLTRAAHMPGLGSDRSALLSGHARAVEALTALGVDSALLATLESSQAALDRGQLATYAETPDPFVCRKCGHLTFENGAACPNCGSHPETFKRFRPIYWIEAMDPFESLASLRSTPEKVAALLADITADQAERSPAAGSWSLRQAVTHLRDAQGVLETRVNLILDSENPVLESKAVFEWATNDANQPVSTRAIIDAYHASRTRTLARLENIPLRDWWRRGRHEEFGELKLYQQVSYFANHELTHLSQLEDLARMARGM